MTDNKKDENGLSDTSGADDAQGKNNGTLIFDATCAPQNIRFPTDTYLLNHKLENAEEIIDMLHAAGFTDGRKP